MSVSIYLESSPNPHSLKFVLNKMIVPEGMSLDFPDLESSKGSPLATEIFTKFSFIKRVFFMSNFVTLTKEESIEWDTIKDELKSFLKDYFDANKSIVVDDLSINKFTDEINEDDPEIVKKIKELLAEYVRPGVEDDGGAIKFHSYENGVVKVLLQGSCNGCAFSTLTLKSGIENLFKRMIPEIESVIAEGV